MKPLSQSHHSQKEMPHTEDVRNKWMEEKMREEEKEGDSGESREWEERDYKKCPTTIGKCPVEAVQKIL